MAESKQESIVCSACGRQYRWDRKLAGRKVRCKCGTAVRVPKVMPGHGGTYELAEPTVASMGAGQGTPRKSAPQGAACPACGAEISDLAVICVQCGFNLKSGKQIETTVAKASARRDGRDSQEGFFSHLGLMRTKNKGEMIA